MDHASLFNDMSRADWQPALHDPCTGDWTEHWALDGIRAGVTNSPKGMLVSAGPVAGDNAGHAVLWTRQSFQGDLKVEYDFARMDTINRYVNIIYLHATGTGQGPYAEDIAAWRHLREIPYMATYFTHMNALHVSYAAFGNRDDTPSDYIRARRYPISPPEHPFAATALEGELCDTGLFEAGKLNRITVIKRGARLSIRVANDEQTRICTWDTSAYPDLDHGRIGLRQMFTRCSRYRDVRVSTCAPS